MVRVKQAFAATVQLYLTGPKSILTEPVTADARLSHTWLEFLNGELGLKIVPESGIFVCTTNYTPSAPREGQRWRSDLNDEIREFIMKFERKRKQFSVRFCHPNNILTYNFNHSAVTLGCPQSTYGDHPHADIHNASGPSPLTPGPRHGMNITPIVPPKVTLHSNQRPNIVIPTTGLMGPPPPPGPKRYQKPRYNNANGLPSRPTNGNTTQQQTYRTRQKRHRHHEQSETLPETTLHSAGGKHRRVDNASTSSNLAHPPPPQSSVCVASLSAVKLEPVVEPQWVEFWDESSAVNGQGGGLSGGEEAEVPKNGGGRRQEEELTSDSNGTGAADEEEDDNLSLMTAATAEENELRRQGIRVEDVKSLVEGRMTRFSNAYMLRVREEMRKLKKNNMWDRNVTRAPLACYLLQEVFRE